MLRGMRALSRAAFIMVLLVLGIPSLLGESSVWHSPNALLAAVPVFLPVPDTDTFAATSSLVRGATTSVSSPQSPTKKERERTDELEDEAERNTGFEPKTRDDGIPRVFRTEGLYGTDPLSFDEVNLRARDALVNILCTPKSASANPSSGSGVLIAPRVILTNAHVAQYVLLAQSGLFDASCVARAGAPAVPRYAVRVIHLPESWLKEHAADIRMRSRLGTGEHDWALLLATPLSPAVTQPTPLFPDIRPGAIFVDDAILAAAYPAEFVGNIIMQTQLHPSSAVTVVDKLMTFATSSVDVVSIGSPITAQAGSSGGAAVNQWGKLVGIITTTSEGATTGDRSLRVLTVDYINRDMFAEIGSGLDAVLSRDPSRLADIFDQDKAAAFVELFLPSTQ